MKRIFILITVLVSATTWAQIPVTDVAANGNLAAINSQLSSIALMVEQQSTVGLENKYENYAQKILGQKNLAFLKEVEDYMWKADEYLKKGREIQMIYDKEEEILKKLKEVKKNAANYGRIEANTSLVNSLNKNISTTLNNVGALVDGAQAILGDRNARMTTAERREILKETLGKMMIIESVLDNMNYQTQVNKISSEKYNAAIEYQRGLEQRMRTYLKKGNK
mgnify:FL=1|jgi:hypothetical protein